MPVSERLTDGKGGRVDVVWVTLMQTGRSKLGSVSMQKLTTDTRIHSTDTTAKTRAARELSGSSQNSHSLLCHSDLGSRVSFSMMKPSFSR